MFVHGVSEGAASISISATGFDEARCQVTVAPPTLVLSKPSAAYVGGNAELGVSLNGRVRPGAQFTVSLKSSDSTVVTAPSSVVIEAGKSSATVAISVLKEGRVTLTADAPGLASDSRLSVELVAELRPLRSVGAARAAPNLAKGLPQQ